MKKQTERLIKEMVRRIVERFNPEKVILFEIYTLALPDLTAM